jgi:hypothetical protein
MKFEDVDRINLAYGSIQWRSFADTVMNLLVP